jgi:CspA family cold shock protein
MSGFFHCHYFNSKKNINLVCNKLGMLNKKSYICSIINYNTQYKMKKGTVKFFNDTKGFGFIVDDESKSEYFVHVSGLIDEVKEGDEVEFELQEGRKGLNAVNVKLA